MAVAHADDEALPLVVEWFSRQQASTIPQPLKGPLQLYLARLPPTERRSVIPKRKRAETSDNERDEQDKRRSGLSTFERDAREFLRAEFAARDESPSLKKQARMWHMVNALNSKDLPTVPDEGFWRPFASAIDRPLSNTNSVQPLVPFAPTQRNGLLLTPESMVETTQNPLPRLFKLHKSVGISTQLHNLASRILAIMIHHHHGQIGSIGIDRQAREEALLRRTGVSSEEFQEIRAKAQGWLRVISVFGIGVLAVTGPETNDEFEKHATLPFLNDCFAFFEAMYPDVQQRISSMNRSVGTLFLQVDESCTKTRCTLLDGSGKLAKALREAFPEPKSDLLSTGLERRTTSSLAALATVAAAAAAGDSSSAAGSTNEGIDTVRLQECVSHGTTSTALFGPTLLSQWRPPAEQLCPQQTAATHVPPLGAQEFTQSGVESTRAIMEDCIVPLPAEEAASCEPHSSFAPSIAVYDDTAATRQIRVQEVQPSGNQPDPSQGHRDGQSWSQGIANQDDPFDVALNKALDQFGRTETTSLGGTTEWDYDFWGLVNG